MTSSITVGRKCFRQCDLFLTQVVTPVDGMPGPRLVCWLAAHQSSTSRRASWTDMIIRQAQTLLVELIYIRSLNNGIAVASQIPVALIISDHENDVWLVSGVNRKRT